MRHSPLVLVIPLLLVTSTGISSPAAVGDGVVPGEIRTDATFEHIDVLWWIEGDDDLDSSMSLEFRRPGEGNWRPGAPAVRAHPNIRVQDGPLASAKPSPTRFSCATAAPHPANPSL